MTSLIYLIPAALLLGALGLSGFLWALRSGQYEDLDGAAERILIDSDDSAEDTPRSQSQVISGQVDLKSESASRSNG
ncbi:cbb3-type cytochrome oxidase assembly protein CcoS [Mesorhizobium erdmanii]|uniref:Cbb3-type cytochrome oxidase assembly protein CcoS n=1 Tax=Mesorhizobium erdmanii TaxID=1777866 RepID=A0A6M7UPC4_9HYPH|nr:cytochrome oxidase maturation protein, cbb3-type [Mesorhizobium loti]QKC78924.1 cbb3-type cytochrome oxidase assembly protein CcoS [Mesorhizobium erdmanii]